MSVDGAAGETRGRTRGVFVQSILWALFLLFTTTLTLEWAVVFYPVYDLPPPYADIFQTFHDLRLALLNTLSFVLPEQSIEYVGIVFSLGGLCITLMMISARQSLAATSGGDDVEADGGFGVLTFLEIWIGLIVVIVLWMLATELTNAGLEDGNWTPTITMGGLSLGLMVTAWFAGYVRVGPLRVNPLRWIIAALAISYAMTLL